MDGSAERIFDRQHRAVRNPELDSLEGNLELVARDGLAVRVRLPGGGLGVSARDALVGHAELGAVHGCWGEVGDCEGLGRLRSSRR